MTGEIDLLPLGTPTHIVGNDASGYAVRRRVGAFEPYPNPSYFTPSQLGGAVAYWLRPKNRSRLALLGENAMWVGQQESVFLDLAQTEAGMQPLIDGNEIIFDGVDDYLASVAVAGSTANIGITGTTERHAFVVCRRISGVGPIFHWGAQSNGNAFGLTLDSGVAAKGYVWGGTDLSFGTATTAKCLLYVRSDGTTLYGAQDGNSTITTQANAANTTDGPLYVGARPTGITGYANAGLSELILVTGTLTTANRQKIEGFLAWEHGTVSRLAADHPYKTIRPGA
jgi:hypothetical protein